MRTRALTLTPRRRGFTLVEILVVMVIIALLAAGAILSLSLLSGDSELQQEGQRLTELINYAHEQAALQTREFGLYCSDHGYRFVVFDPSSNQWLAVDDDDALRRRELPSDLTVHLVVEAREVVLPTAEEEQKQAAAAQQAAASAAAAAAAAATAAQQALDPQLGSLPVPGSMPQPGAVVQAPVQTMDSTGSAAQTLQPQVMIFSNGDLTSFQLTLDQNGRTVTLQSDDEGQVQLHELKGHSA